MWIREWRNGRGGKWSRRIQEYEGNRLKITYGWRDLVLNKTQEFWLDCPTHLDLKVVWGMFREGIFIQPDHFKESSNAE